MKGIWKSEQSIVKVSNGNALSLDANHVEHTSLEGAVYITKGRRTMCHMFTMDNTTTQFNLNSQVTGESDVSESRVREIRLHGLGGGVLNLYENREEGCLP
jgi:hypothetical protein